MIFLDNINWVYLLLNKDGKFVNIIIGVNAPRLLKTITDEVENYENFKRGEIEIVFVSIILLTYIVSYYLFMYII